MLPRRQTDQQADTQGCDRHPYRASKGQQRLLGLERIQLAACTRVYARPLQAQLHPGALTTPFPAPASRGQIL